MSFSFPHKSTQEIRTTFNAFGLLWLVPCYILLVWDEKEETWFIDSSIVEANWIPKPLWWLAKLITIIYGEFLHLMGITANIPVLVLSTWELEDEEA